MSADDPSKVAEPAKPAEPSSTGVTQELPDLGQARQNFRDKVKSFVVAFDQHPDSEDIKKGNGKEAYQNLRSFLANEALPKRDDEKKVTEQMALLHNLLVALIKDQVAKGIRAQEYKAETEKVSHCLKEAESAEDEFNQAYEQDQKQSKATPMGFADNQDLFRYSDKDQMGAERYTVMTTVNTREGFQAALTDYANSTNDKGEPRKWGNVNLVNPPVTVEKLQANADYKNNVFDQIIDTLNAGLYPENDIRKMVEALAGPSKNDRAWFVTAGSEAKLKAQQMQKLKDTITNYHTRHERVQKGLPEHEDSTLQAQAVAQKKTAAKPTNDDAKAKEKAKADAAAIKMTPTNKS